MEEYNHYYRKSKFAKHLLERNHPSGTLEQIMTILHNTKKGRMSNTIDKYYIY
jgi:hypothetical protein